MKDPPRGLMVFLGILPEGLLEIYDAANTWNPTNERKLILRITDASAAFGAFTTFNFREPAIFRHS